MLKRKLGKVMSAKVIAKNSFNSGILIISPSKIPSIFPTVGQAITGVPSTRRHYSGKCEDKDDLLVQVLDSREVQVRRCKTEMWVTRVTLSPGTYVSGVGRLR